MYKHTQIGWGIIISLLALIILPVSLILLEGNLPTGSVKWINSSLIGTIAILVLFLVLFPSLTVEVDAKTVTAKFGIGIIRKKNSISEIESCETVRNKWWHGFGLRYIGDKTWMFNVQGLDAVELSFKNGKKFRIGTDDPEELARFIKNKIS